MNRARLEFATVIFLSEMRRQAVKSSKNTEIAALDGYPPEQRSALMSAIEKAVKSTETGAEEAFQKWLERRNQEKVTS